MCVRSAAVMTPRPVLKPPTPNPTLGAPDARCRSSRRAQLNISENPALLKQTVMLKLNGGLGTGMGLEKVRSTRYDAAIRS